MLGLALAETLDAFDYQPDDVFFRFATQPIAQDRSGPSNPLDRLRAQLFHAPFTYTAIQAFCD